MPKWLKYALLVAGPLVLVAGIFFATRGSKSTVPDALRFVDVVTGELTTVSKDKIISIPLKGKGGQRTLLPVEKDSSGNLVVVEFYRGDLDAMIKSNIVTAETSKVDPSTFRVRSGS